MNHISTKFHNLMVKLLVGLVRFLMAGKKTAQSAFGGLAAAILWIGRRLGLPLAIKVYRLIVKLRRAFAPARRRLILVATHRGILHLALFVMVAITAGGNIYAQTQSAESTGANSVMYRYLAGQSDIDSSADPSAVSEIASGMAADSDADTAESSEADTMIELGALMPEVVPGASAPVHRTQIENYAVEQGDTLSGIASKFNISIATILWANNLTVHDFIQPGQKLKILPTTGILYAVKSGDTIGKIAAAYGVDPIEIKSFNSMGDETSLQKGQELVLPGGKPLAAPTPVKPKPKPVASSPSPAKPVPAAEDDGKTDLLWPSSIHYISMYFGVWFYLEGRHLGLDLAGPTGSPIYAAEDGIVTHAGCGKRGCKKSYGSYIDIDHGDNLMTRYGHTSKLLVAVGDQVHRGQLIGLMGSTGLSTGPHLHFEVRKKGVAVNPLPYIR